jgi:hypothetical protein
MTQPSGRLAASRRAQRSKTVVGHHSQFVPEHTHWPATTTNEKTVVRHSLGLWFRYSGRLPKPVWRSPIARHTRTAFAAAVQGLPHLRGAGRQHGARDLVGFETRGVEGQPQKSSMRRMTRSGLPPALRIAHRLRVADDQQEYGDSRVLGGFEMARLHSLRGLVTKGPAREESDASVFSPTLRGGRPEEGWGRLSQPFAPSPLASRFLGGEGCYVLTDCRRSRSSPSAAAEAGSGSLHHLCRCHKSTSRLT